jgi:hypothetical protein
MSNAKKISRFGTVPQCADLPDARPKRDLSVLRCGEFRRIVRQRKAWLSVWVFVSMISVVLVAPNYAHAFRTAGDSVAIQSAAPVRWKDGRFYITLNNQSPSTFSIEEYESAVREALGNWSAPSCSALLVVYGGQTDLLAKPDALRAVVVHSTQKSSRAFE